MKCFLLILISFAWIPFIGEEVRGCTCISRASRPIIEKPPPARKGEIRIRAPKLPAQGVPGIYMLFVLDQAPVQSLAKRVYLQ